jgi:hypothetical protein
MQGLSTRGLSLPSELEAYSTFLTAAFRWKGMLDAFQDRLVCGMCIFNRIMMAKRKS